ncbi:MAG: tetratricopeptide repeat protein, partial [Bacteroidales bacterium]|nr:tetratricopeptide repeat protein [Bacteroidales bacterium]
MKKQESKKNTFFKDILERRVPQIVGVYMAACWGIIQFVMWVVDEFVLSHFLPQFTFVILLSLLPTVILLSYFHGKPGRDSWTRIEKIGVPLNLIFTIVILIFFFQGKELGATEKKITIFDEAGNKIERTIVKNQFRKKMVVFAFENTSNDTSFDWLQFGLPYLIDYDLSQDFYIDAHTSYNFVEKIRKTGLSIKQKLPLMLQLKIARDSHLSFLLTGTYAKQNGNFEVLTKLYQVKNSKLIAENSFSGKNIFEIGDNITNQTKKDFNIPSKHLENVKDLPVSELLTSSIPAFKEFIQGINLQEFENNYDKGIQSLEISVKNDPSFAIAYWTLAIQYFQSNKTEKSKIALQKVMENLYKLPERMQFQVKSIYYFMEGQPAKRHAILKMWVDLFPEDILAHKYLYSSYRHSTSEIDKAIGEIERILEIDPTQYDFIQVLGGLYKSIGEYDNALEYYQLYAKHFPNVPKSFSSIGSLHETMGKFKEAREFYEKALLLDPGDSDIMVDIADIEEKLGNFIEAEQQYKNALSNCQTPQQLKNVYESLGGLYYLQGQIKKAISYSDLMLKERKKYMDPINYLINEMSAVRRYLDIGKKEIAFAKINSIKLEPPLDKIISLFRLSLYLELKNIKNAEKELVDVH